MRVAVLSFDDPWHASHGGTQRTLMLMTAIRGLGHEPVCVFAGASDDPSVVERRKASGFETVPVAGHPLGVARGKGSLGRLKRRYLPLPTIRGGAIAELHAALRGLGPVDLLVTQQLRGVQYLESLPGAKLWLDQTDLWSRFLEVEAARVRGLRRLTALAQRRAVLGAERASVGLAAAVSAAGAGDASRLAEATGRTVTWLPTPSSQVAQAVSRSSGERTVGLLANFEYWPNVDAYEALVRHWLAPLQRAGWRVLVAGYGSDRLQPIPGVELLGAVGQPAEFYARVDATLAPLRLGAGIKVKVLESLYAGRPVFASAAALEGFPPGIAPGAVEVSWQRPEFPAAPDWSVGDELLTEAGWESFSVAGFTRSVERVLAEVNKAVAA